MSNFGWVLILNTFQNACHNNFFLTVQSSNSAFIPNRNIYINKEYPSFRYDTLVNTFENMHRNTNLHEHRVTYTRWHSADKTHIQPACKNKQFRPNDRSTYPFDGWATKSHPTVYFIFVCHWFVCPSTAVMGNNYDPERWRDRP